MTIEIVDSSNYSAAYSFLKSVPSINKIDDNILKNGCIVLDDEKVIGSISFEEFDSVGLIRYFVFKKNISNIYLVELLKMLEDNAIKMNINKMLCVADNYEIEELFKELGFVKLNKKIFLNEDVISNYNFSSSNFLIKTIA